MYEFCIENFLKTSDPSHIERHSDSSDFENTNKIPVVSPKHGKHSMFMDKSCFIEPEKDVNSPCNKNTYTKIKCDNKLPIKKYRKKLSNMNHIESVPKHQSNELPVYLKDYQRSRGDQSPIHLTEKSYSKSIIRNKVMPRLSTLFRQSHNCTKHMECIEEDSVNNIQRCDRYCPHCKHQRLSKNTRRRRGYSVQPVYAMKETVHGFQFPNTIQQVSVSNVRPVIINKDGLSVDNNSTYSVSDKESIKKVYQNNIIKKVKQRLEKEKINYRKKANSRNEQHQFPSKSQLKSPYQIFTSSSCQARSASLEYNGLNRLPSSSSGFWDFLAGKIKFQVQKAEIIKPCYCVNPPGACSPTTCEHKISRELITEPTTNLLPKMPSCCRIVDPSSSSSSLNKNKKKEMKENKRNKENKENKEDKVICECNNKDKKKKDSKANNASSMAVEQDTTPCQENHEDVIAAIAQKYNGEILCIHNPPCVLINGCLNLPPLKTEGQGNYFPVTQTKKSSFSQMCKKIKRSKEKHPGNEQASQYHPPYGELRKCLPEFGTEKIIQSACNHSPPCEIVRGCYRAKYNPELQNSCIHVPSCNKLPECLLDKTNVSQNNKCVHHPRCAELPLCSRKYIVLTAKEDVGTQIKPKTNMFCRHKPPCFMIPKCIARAICSDYIPIGAIPGCVHQPSCEMIPACCRKSAKETVSVPSQYPNKSCRIV